MKRYSSLFSIVLISCMVIISANAFAEGPHKYEHKYFPRSTTSFHGIIESIGADMFILNTGSDIYTVEVTGSTVIKSGKDIKSFGDLEVGMGVAVGGDLVGDVITARKINIKKCMLPL